MNSKVAALLAGAVLVLGGHTAAIAASVTYKQSVSYGAAQIVLPAYSGPRAVHRGFVAFKGAIGIGAGSYDCSALTDCYGSARLDYAWNIPSASSGSLTVDRFKCIHSTDDCSFERGKTTNLDTNRVHFRGDPGAPLVVNLSWSESGGFLPAHGGFTAIVHYRPVVPVPATLPLLVGGFGGLGLLAWRKRKS